MGGAFGGYANDRNAHLSQEAYPAQEPPPQKKQRGHPQKVVTVVTGVTFCNVCLLKVVTAPPWAQSSDFEARRPSGPKIGRLGTPTAPKQVPSLPILRPAGQADFKIGRFGTPTAPKQVPSLPISGSVSRRKAPQDLGVQGDCGRRAGKVGGGGRDWGTGGKQICLYRLPLDL